ncbi:MAG: hypothetical protein E7Z79_02395 [Methanobrevibacter thaueri]|uniref:Uncharacterized protein n=1 Tax=Methanobrevibacter thaueri TaxID=190975 RepID=A0A8T3V411_9EURY|nr:hypothetical protein [Methanobrevibacter thaueri]MBE6501272.1 hypothetical protein [Methanobrevibacter thaueri]
MKILKICLILTILLLSIGIVNAADDNQTDTLEINEDNQEYVFEQTTINETQDTVQTNEENLITASNESNIISSMQKPTLTYEYDEDEYEYDDEYEYEIDHDTIAAKATLADRTFKIGKYSVTISKYDYAIFYNAHYAEDLFYEEDYLYDSGDEFDWYTVNSQGLYYSVKKYTGKTVKQKLGFGYKGTKYKTVKSFYTKKKAKKYIKKLHPKFRYSIKKVKVKNKTKYRIIKEITKYKKVVTKKAKVYMIIRFGGMQSGFPHKYSVELTTNYENPGYDIVKGGLFKYKSSYSLRGVKTAKVKSYW